MSVLTSIGIILGVLALAVGAHALSYLALHSRIRGSAAQVGPSLVRNTRAPARLILPLVAAEIAIAAVHLPSGVTSLLLHVVGIALVLAVAWLVVRLTYVLEDVVLGRYHLEEQDNLHARQVHTQIVVLRRVTVVVVAIVSLAVALLSFPSVRTAGAGLLASAGVAGLVAGIAAKPVATNVFAGIQIALSQPMRVDDVVVVEGHWGRIEEIALTYVVVRVWDLRRLVLPISYFIENPFENWTRSTADILGWVHLEVDYRVPVAALRERLEQVVTASPLWDAKVVNLQVTNLGNYTVQLRALMSAPDSSASWDLQCEVREALLTFMQERYPWAMPRLRAELTESFDLVGEQSVKTAK